VAVEIEIKLPNILVVEGKDELNFFAELLRNQGIQGVQILNVAGKDNIGPGLKAIAKAPNFKSLVTKVGIVRDADDNFNETFGKIQAALRGANLDVPTQPLVPTTGTPAVNVFICPALNTGGALEDLCIASVQNDPAIKCVDDYVNCLVAQKINSSKSVSKVKVQVLLASRVNGRGTPVRNMGEAALSKQWDWTQEAFADVKQYTLTTFG